VTPGVFNANSKETRVLYAEVVSEDRERLGTVFMWEQLPDGREATTWANAGRQSLDVTTGSLFLLLDDGRRYEGIPGQADYRVVEYKTLEQIGVNEATGSNRVGVTGILTDKLPANSEGVAEFHWRLALPIFTLACVFNALAMARVRPRASRFSRVLPGLLVLLCYYLAMMGNHYALEEALVPGVIGMWGVHGVMLTVFIWLLYRSDRPVS
jgi:lipopolysaccharide export system permease protein